MFRILIAIIIGVLSSVVITPIGGLILVALIVFTGKKEK